MTWWLVFCEQAADAVAAVALRDEDGLALDLGLAAERRLKKKQVRAPGAPFLL